MNWKINYKTKDEAKIAILNGLMENPAVAGTDGTLFVGWFGEWLTIRPKKRKPKEPTYG